MSVTHIRQKDDQTRALCGEAKPIESLSFRHVWIARMMPRDIVEAYDSHKNRIEINRADSIRDGIDTLPNPVCVECLTEFVRIT